MFDNYVSLNFCLIFLGEVTDDLIDVTSFAIVIDEEQFIAAEEQQTTEMTISTNDTCNTYAEESRKSTLLIEAMAGACSEYINMEPNDSTMDIEGQPDHNSL